LKADANEAFVQWAASDDKLNLHLNEYVAAKHTLEWIFHDIVDGGLATSFDT
jgi:hypothetical protein